MIYKSWIVLISLQLELKVIAFVVYFSLRAYLIFSGRFEVMRVVPVRILEIPR